MEQQPKISVIMSVYNGEQYVEEAINSVISQTFGDFELIVINDCSTDKTEEIIFACAKKDGRVKPVNNEVNLKLPTSLNKAVSLSRGKYIARMDADDICLPDRLEKQYKFMEENENIAISSCRFFTLKNNVISSGGCGGRCDNESVRTLLLVTNPILHPGVIMRSEVIKSLCYDTARTCTEDLELWTRAAKNGYELAILPEYLLLYRLHDKQITANSLERQYKEVKEIHRDYYKIFSQTMEDELSEFLIKGIYFRGEADINKFIRFSKWLKKVNRTKKAFKADAVNYALFEILAEYKRSGITKAEIIKGLGVFSPCFLVSEALRRKKAAKRDGKACIKAAESIGLKRTGGTVEFPAFEISLKSKLNELPSV